LSNWKHADTKRRRQQATTRCPGMGVLRNGRWLPCQVERSPQLTGDPPDCNVKSRGPVGAGTHPTPHAVASRKTTAVAVTLRRSLEFGQGLDARVDAVSRQPALSFSAGRRVLPWRRKPDLSTGANNGGSGNSCDCLDGLRGVARLPGIGLPPGGAERGIAAVATVIILSRVARRRH
jgi:hypothetical protein